MAAIQRSTQRPAFADQALMAHHLGERARAHPGCQRLALRWRNERGLLSTGFVGWRGLDAARWHPSIVQAGRLAGSGHGAESFVDAPIYLGRGGVRGESSPAGRLAQGRG